MGQIDLEILGYFCDEANDLLTHWESVCLKIQKSLNSEDPELKKNLLDELFRYGHNLKGSSRTVGLEVFGNFVHKIEDGITVIKSDEVILTQNICNQLLKAQTVLLNWVLQLKTNAEYVPEEMDIFLENFKNAFSNKIEEQSEIVAKVDPIVNIDEIKVEQEILKEQDVSALVIEKEKEKENVEKLEQKNSPTKKKSQQNSSSPDETVRVSAKKLDQILEMVGELSIHQSVIYHARQIFEGKNAVLSHAAYLSRKLTRELYEKTLSLRMYPIQPVFQRLERSIQDISQSVSKEVQIIVKGGEVELDKTVSEKIIEPLTHMVRNSVDHGIETPEEREKLGKPRVGTIRLKAIQESNSVSLIIEDDGKGLNEKKIIEKALSKGLIKDPSLLKKNELYALIFLPGFSTAEKVTDISGRGVGMDVVMKTIEELQGSVQIASEVNKGTKFIISLPTSLSIIDALIIRLGQSDFAVPVSMVSEIIDLTDIGINENQNMFQLRDTVLPLEKLSHYLSGVMKINQKEEPMNSALVTQVGRNKISFRVNKIMGQQQIVVRKIGDGMSGVFGLAGGTILADGQPGLIIDLHAIANSFVKKIDKLEKSA